MHPDYFTRRAKHKIKPPWKFIFGTDGKRKRDRERERDRDRERERGGGEGGT